ncbi:E3 ubiquitin-protein ligase MARCHF2 isoform X1 [Cricetulus griseus]|uniref:E3 ubiquitin-protein ligase MARCHF2 n=1 Tax=Cricetulus griseus TaxID=10029 RepID=A0A9J7G3N0_CRIGR|nr:E3 ubiquitin-protein ligase MARCHF2 isoform X1 [Cricetulus griseus]XP_007649321.1 E3 ubiquitin-protein ligase MARCHF2 isoform X1 [Cricetulus griseus]XP_027273834.1 E3 ubiquitin-protein ligase MARCHF2 isoform X1 [Cricetulus griseus]XP_027273835.1 E3 ubiquitin-protein ligase MARCHF2 isoform X1 [Cricetulus griseus]
MTTGDCCHLPGSLCDCSGSPAFSKVVEATGLGPPQYVAQVTSRDGRLLSTVIRALDTPSDCPFCRICHEGANGENLLSPCGCTGTLGAVHKSCLEKWLSSSNTSYCELCHTEFAVEKRPRPLTEWLKDPGPRTEKRTLCCDMVCFVFITPLAAISGWLCLRGAQDHLRLHSRLEAVGLIALTIALFTIYVLWTLDSLGSRWWIPHFYRTQSLSEYPQRTKRVSFRYHCQLYSEWRKTNQKVRLKIREADGSEDPHHSLLAAGLLKKVAEETPV